MKSNVQKLIILKSYGVDIHPRKVVSYVPDFFGLLLLHIGLDVLYSYWRDS